MLWCIGGFLICLCLSAFFSSAEMSYSSANTIRLEKAMDEGSRRARIACKICQRYDDALSAIQIGNNLVNIAASSLASVIMVLIHMEQYTWLTTLSVTVLVILFGETMPKIIAKKNANRLAEGYAPVIQFLMIVLYPVVWLVVSAVHLLTLPLKGESTRDDQDAAVEELQSILETVEDEGVIDEDRSELLQAALDFSEISASEVMTARVDVLALDIADDPAELYEAIEKAQYTRIPVYEDSVDNIIGILYLNHYFKALVDQGEHVDVRSLLMEPCYVYKTMKLPAVLSELRRAKMHMAVVTDEYGGFMGILTMEDVLEQIVGDIWDETDTVEEEVVQREDGIYELDGDLSISEFCELMGLDESAFDIESATVGGWTIEMFGSFPQAGDSFNYGNLTVTVLEMADGLRVEKVQIVRHPEEIEE
jgi:putative hemolysin